ncbi:MAG TPA: ABC transporter ATP-binding protein [Acidobacteriota bacterium]
MSSGRLDPTRRDHAAPATRLLRVLQTVRRFSGLLRPHRGRIAWASLAMLGSTVTGLLLPWPVQGVIDGVLLGRRDQGWLRWLGESVPSAPTALLLTCCGALILLTLLQSLFAYWQNLLTATVGHRVISTLRLEIFDQLQRLSLGFHRARRSGDLLVRLTGDVSMLREILLPALLEAASRFLILIGVLLLMGLIDFRLTVIVLLMLPLLLLSTIRFGSALRQVVRQQRRKEGKIAAVVGEALGSVAVVQAFAQEHQLATRFSRQNSRSLRAGLKSLRLEEKMARSVELTLAFGSALVLWFGGQRALQHSLSPGELIVFLSYLRSIYKPIQTLVRLSGRASKAVACGERILEVLDSKEQVTEPNDAEPTPKLSGGIVFDRVTFGYQDGLPALQDVSFSIAAGERVGLVGHSGAGKSTVLALLLRLYDPDQGRILVDGFDIRRLRLATYRSQIAVVLQEPFLFGISVAENIGFGRPEAEPHEIEAAARVAGAHDFITALPGGYDAVLGERGASLSRGQQQRIAIARAVLRRASILIFDEPTTGLDALTETEVRAALAQWSWNTTCIWIDHRLPPILDCPRVLVLQGGRCVQDGSPRHLVQAPGALQELFQGVA